MNILKLALDKSARRIDADGRLHIDMSHISKANICPYYGSEIPGYVELGLDAGKVYRLLRDPVELERAAFTFARLPILHTHVPITVDLMANDEEMKKLIVGAIGSDVSFTAPYLNADLCIWDKDSIAGIETEQIKELSCASSAASNSLRKESIAPLTSSLVILSSSSSKAAAGGNNARIALTVSSSTLPINRAFALSTGEAFGSAAAGMLVGLGSS